MWLLPRALPEYETLIKISSQTKIKAIYFKNSSIKSKKEKQKSCPMGPYSFNQNENTVIWLISLCLANIYKMLINTQELFIAYSRVLQVLLA